MITTTLFKDPIFNNLDRIFNDSFEKTNNQKTNIETNDEDYRVQIAVPGLTKENLKITVKESTLTISYDRPKRMHLFL